VRLLYTVSGASCLIQFDPQSRSLGRDQMTRFEFEPGVKDRLRPGHVLDQMTVGDRRQQMDMNLGYHVA
jgi:hypothetical protein